VAMRLMFFWFWRWSFSWRFQQCSASTFRSCVRHLCLQNFFRPSTKYMFFWRCSHPSPVRVSKQKTKRRLKENLGLAKPYIILIFLGWSNQEMKKKNQEKN
jgi:hypothetical protein